MYYCIFSDLGNSLCLDISNVTGNVIVNTQNTSDTQLWQPIALADGQTTYGVAFLNKATQKVMWAPNADQALQMVDISSSWQNDWIGWNPAGGGAIQLNADTKLNLNVQGGQPNAGSNVIAYHWQGGHSNETWQWQPADF